jgi:hypothetical protein
MKCNACQNIQEGHVSCCGHRGGVSLQVSGVCVCPMGLPRGTEASIKAEIANWMDEPDDELGG